MALAYWKSLPSDEGAAFDAVITLDAADIAPQVSWGTSPEQVIGVDGTVPAPESFADEGKRKACESALAYMGLTPNTKITDIPVDLVFIGSCTNGRIEDFRIAAEVTKGTHVAKGVTAIAVPGPIMSRSRLKKRAWIKFLSMPVGNGVIPGAPCVWR